MRADLTANREIEDYEKEDLFDFKIKADAIKAFLEYNVETLKKNKMLALYGNWGSGKTSMMKYLEEKINKDIYYPIFFHAWEHEKDDNLALSLCDVLSSSVKINSSRIILDFKNEAISILKGFTSGISVKLANPVSGFEIGFEGTKAVEQYDKSKKEEHSSFFTNNKKFKESFQKVEDNILKHHKATRIIVFVDDLDRCEPENVLNLITALKLFFTYGDNTIFFAGLDKDAVTKAVTTKYQDIVKSEEYLEKVFDITFNIPKAFSLEKYLSNYFSGGKKNRDGTDLPNVKLLNHFFNSIHFTNPRHIKKVINKYEILKAFKSNPELSLNIKDLIPELLNKEGNGNIIETIFCLYFIILHENYPNDFEVIENYNRKHSKYVEPYIQSNPTNNNANRMPTNIASSNLSKYYIKDVKSQTFKELLMPKTFGKGDKISFSQFILLLSNDKPTGFGELDDRYLQYYDNHFFDQGILTLFCKFLIKNKYLLESSEYSNYIFWNYFRMAKYLL